MAGTIKCSNCSREIPATAKACKFCEAAVQEEPSEDEKKFAKEMLDQMDPEARGMLIDAIKNADTADELIRSIFVGSCPRCGSDKTGDGENDPELLPIEKAGVGPRCLRDHRPFPRSELGPEKLKLLALQQSRQCRQHVVLARRRGFGVAKVLHQLRQIIVPIAFPQRFVRCFRLHAFPLIIAHARDSNSPARRPHSMR